MSDEERLLAFREERIALWAEEEGVEIDDLNYRRIIAARRTRDFMEGMASAQDIELIGKVISRRCWDRMFDFMNIALVERNLDSEKVKKAFITAVGAYDILDGLEADVRGGEEAQRILKEESQRG